MTSTRRSARTLNATVAGLYRTMDSGFATAPVTELDLTFEGIEGDRHGGATRRTGGREPWYPRRTQIRNERQVSIVSETELAEIAVALSVERVAPEWIGANLTLDGIERLSWLPPRTLLFFENGATLKVDGDNGPCRASGRSVAQQSGGGDHIERAFVRHARHRRGLVAWVEKPGRIAAGERVEARLPEQWIYE